jgi:hypothetical protein
MNMMEATMSKASSGGKGGGSGGGKGSGGSGSKGSSGSGNKGGVSSGNGPSTTGQPSGGGRGNNPPK